MHTGFHFNNLMRFFNYFFNQVILQPPALKLAFCMARYYITTVLCRPIPGDRFVDRHENRSPAIFEPRSGRFLKIFMYVYINHCSESIRSAQSPRITAGATRKARKRVGKIF